MAELTENRSTLEREGKYFNFPVLNEEIMYAGGLAAVLKSTGEVQMASDTASLVVIGRVESYVDNSADGRSVLVKSGIFKFENSDTHALGSVHIGSKCYVEDDSTVSSNGCTNSVIAGVVAQIDSDGVWVDTSAAVVAAIVSPAIPEADAVSAPAECADITTDLTGVDTGTDMTAAQAAQIVADLTAHKTAIDANNVAVDAIIDALQVAGLMAS